jgi:hypothetical protein
MITRISCETCGADILPATAEATGGICMACKQGIRRGPVDRHGRPLEVQEPQTTNGKEKIASNEDGSDTHLCLGRMSGADVFLNELKDKKELLAKVTNLILNGKAVDIEKKDLNPLMRLWIKGAEAERSGDLFSLTMGPSFFDEFKSLSRILTAAGINLEQFATAAFSPEPPQLPRKPKKARYKSFRHMILPLILSVFLVLAIGLEHVDYSFYVVVRFLVCASFGWWSLKAHERGQSTWRNIFILTAVFYNPFVPLHLEREWWQVANGLTIAITLVAAAKNKIGEQTTSNI